MARINWKWVLFLFGLGVLYIFVLTPRVHGMTWTAPSYCAVDEAPYCAPDVGNPIDPAETADMVLQMGTVLGPDTTWAVAQHYPTWAPGGSVTWDLPGDLTTGTYYFRVRAYLKDPDGVKHPPCWSNVVVVLVHDRCPAAAVGDLAP